MNHVTTTLKLFFGALLLLLFVVGGYAFMYIQVGVLQERLSGAREEIAILKTMALKKETTEMLLKNTELEREQMLKYFVSREDPTEFLELIESSGRDAGITLDVNSIKVDEGGDELIKHIEISLSVQGEWDNVYHFIYLLEHLPYVSQITRATVTIAKNLENDVWKGIIILTCESV